MKRRLSNKRFINKLESKIKYLRAFPFSSFFFFFNHFHVANIDLSTRCNRTLYIIKLRAPRVRGGKKKEKRRKKKTATVRILYTRARARKYFNRPLPTISLRSSSPLPPLAPCPKTRTRMSRRWNGARIHAPADTFENA